MTPETEARLARMTPEERELLEQLLALQEVERYQRLYAQTRNPVYACRAHDIVRRVAPDRPLPYWIQPYVDRAMAAIANLPDEPLTTTELAARLAAALEFTQVHQGVRKNAVRACLGTEHDHLVYAAHVWHDHLHRADLSIESCIAYVADVHEVSERTVSRAWSEWRTYVQAEFPRAVVLASGPGFHVWTGLGATIVMASLDRYPHLR